MKCKCACIPVYSSHDLQERLHEVSFGLRQGCILSPLLVSLFINSVVTRLKEAEVRVKCWGKLISMLLYADDAVIFAEDEKSMKLGLDVLMGWCREWSVDVNGEKCGVMHMRRKDVERTEEKFYVGEEEIVVVEEYKYLGCVVDECGQCRRMVEERAKAGARALSDWLRRCRASVGEVRGRHFGGNWKCLLARCCCMELRSGDVEGSSDQ